MIRIRLKLDIKNAKLCAVFAQSGSTISVLCLIALEGRIACVIIDLDEVKAII